jgi:hypothetical protein
MAAETSPNVFYGVTAMRHLAVAAVCVALSGLAAADDKKAGDPTGTWKWTVEFNGQTRDMTLKLKFDGDKLTGSMPGRDGQETKIEDGTFKDGEVKFKVTRERNGQKFTTKYTAKVSGDTLKGKAESERGGQTQTREFEAKRAADKDK